MFDPVTARLLRSAPGVAGLNAEDIPGILTRHYARLVSARLRGSADDSGGADSWSPERIADTYELIASLTSEPEARRAAAFVAGTAQQIVGRRAIPQGDQSPGAIIDRDRVAPTISAVLLFLAAEQYADAHEAASDVVFNRDSQIREVRVLADGIVDLAKGHLSSIVDRAGRWRQPELNADLESVALAALLECLVTGIELLAAAVLGVPAPEPSAGRFNGPQDAFSRVLALSASSTELDSDLGSVLHAYAGPHHLASLLIAAAQALEPAALTRLPPPLDANADFWRRWLNLRAERFPFVWPNHREAIAKGFHEPSRSAVIVLPTGAGKTTVSGLKIAGTLARGKKVVFLAPTHALVEQLTNDLQEMFPHEILGSVVSSDFDILFQSGATLREIEVMTPERCLAMLSYAPDAFADVGLMVFDECHLLAPRADKIRRSLDGMLCVLGFSHVAPDADFLFLSAMLQNGEHFAAWVADLTQRECVCVDLLWKPSRQARGVVIYEQEKVSQALQAAESAQKAADKKSKKKAATVRAEAKKRLSVQPLAIWGLQHNWLDGKTAQCAILPVLTEPIQLAGDLRRGSISPKPNANKVAGRLAVAAARNGLKSIVFVNTKDNAVSVARDIAEELDQEVQETDAETERWIALEAELGGRRHAVLPQPAIAVPHNSSMLRLERELAELVFRRANGARVIVATPTLAQGLNLPAHLAILAGDKRADAMGNGRESLEAHEILNAAARAGRAGHVANGVVLLVPEPILTYSGRSLRSEVISKLKSVLPEDDRCVVISDPLTIVLDRVTEGDVADPDARYLINRMAAIGESEGAEQTASLFNLRKSLGAFLARKRGAEAEFEARIGDLRAAIDQNTPEGVEQSVALLASQSGLSMSLLSRLKSKIAAAIGTLPVDVSGWLIWTVRWLSDDTDARTALLREVNGAIRGACGLKKDGETTAQELGFILPGLLAWIEGSPLREIELALHGDPDGDSATKRVCPRARELVGTAIPRGLSFVVGLVSHVASEMQVFDSQSTISREVVESLATAVRRGFKSPEQVAFAVENPTIRSRVQVHTLFALLK